MEEEYLESNLPIVCCQETRNGLQGKSKFLKAPGVAVQLKLSENSAGMESTEFLKHHKKSVIGVGRRCAIIDELAARCDLLAELFYYDNLQRNVLWPF